MIRRIWPVLAVLVACSDNPATVHVIMDVSTAPPAYGRTPYPTDSVRGTPILGLEAMTAGQADLIASHLAALDGFGVRPVIEFPISGDVDPATVPTTTSELGDALAVIDIDPASPLNGTVYAWDWKWDGDRKVIVGAPHAGSQLAEATRYAAVLTTDVHAAGGSKLSTPGLSSLAKAGDFWQATADGYTTLVAMPELAHRIAGLAVFTTEHTTTVSVAARALLASGTVPAPTLAFPNATFVYDSKAKLDTLLGQAKRDTSGARNGLEIWGLDNSTGIAHDHVAVIANGTTTIARFKGADTGSPGPDSKTFQLDANGVPKVQAIDTIPITVILPNTPMPAAGYPVIVFGHGLGGSRAESVYMAEPLTSQGYAIIAIDFWGHGARYDATDGQNNFCASKPGCTGSKNVPDGFADNAGQAAYIAFFENFLNMAAIRDSIRQSALDMTRVATLVQLQPDLTALSAAYGGAVPKLDKTKVAYLGVSFGTIVGAQVAALEPSIGLYVLDVPGGGVLDQLVPNSPEIGTLALPIAVEIYRPLGTLDRFHPLLAGAMQSIVDGADPLSFGPHVLADRFPTLGTGPRHVVCIEVIDDEIVSNPATAALARTMKLGLLTPDLVPPEGIGELGSTVTANVDGQTGVLVQYAPATHGYNWSAQHGQIAYMHGFPFPGDDPFPKLDTPVTVQEPIYETHQQVAQILSTFFAGQAPTVTSTLAPVPY